MSGQKLGIVNLGKAAGKVKFALLDERDIDLINHYAFEARVKVDPDGNGAHIYAYTYKILKGRESGQFLHDFLWERHRGGVASGWKVVHRNGITVDNRLENLMLVPMDTQLVYDDLPSTKNREQSLYWMAVQQLQVAPLECNFNFNSSPLLSFKNLDILCYIYEKHYPSTHVYTKQFSPNGENIHIEHDEVCVYYECHYPPCTNMEKRVREFSICGRCQEVRYCGTFCQQRDWPTHKKFCQERQLFIPLDEESPDR